MSELVESITEEHKQEQKPKKKTYTEKQKNAIYAYRKRQGTTYTASQKQYIYNYNAKIREYAKKYKELLNNGLVATEN